MCFQDGDDLGPGYIMGRVEGETIARKILRDAEFADARPKLARQCGRILAAIHAIDKSSCRRVERGARRRSARPVPRPLRQL